MTSYKRPKTRRSNKRRPAQEQSAAKPLKYAGSRRRRPNIYRPLDPERKEIRLLIVEAGSGDDPICCTFQHAYLSDLSHNTLSNPVPRRSPRRACNSTYAYETISYVWGNPAERGTIYLHGHLTDVPASSERVLRRMRYNDKVRVLWIDAVCVNQNDVEERGHQVGMMGEVYSNTIRNLIWLGEDDGSTAQALTSIEAILGEVRKETNDYETFHDTLFDERNMLRFSRTGFSVDFEPEPLARYYSSPWFFRLWVVQEASLAPRSICCRGSYEIPLEKVLRVATWIVHKWYYFSGPITGSSSGIFNASIIAYTADRDYGLHNFSRRKDPNYHISFANLLVTLRRFHSYDRKDHVFALLGLFQKYEELPSALLPKYTAPLRDVLRDATRFAILQRRDIVVLDHVFRGFDDDDHTTVPTWVPRWDQPRNYEADCPRLGNFFQAHGGKLIDMAKTQTRNPDILSVQGVLVDTVQSTMPVFGAKHWDSAHSMQDLLDGVEAMVNGGDLQYADREGSIATTLIADTDLHRRRASESQSARLYQTYTQFLAETSTMPHYDPFKLPASSTDRERAAAEFDYLFWGACRKRCFFMTASGYIGLGPSIMQAGDFVTVLYGCQWPVILRQSALREEEYELVGMSYVHGIMFGEAIDAHEEEGKEDAVFHLI